MSETLGEVKTELVELRNEVRRKMPTMPEKD
jgi:hypothetical protein